MLEFRSQTGGRIGIFDELQGIAIIEGVTKGGAPKEDGTPGDDTIHFVGIIIQGQLLPLWHETSYEQATDHIAQYVAENYEGKEE